MKKHDVQYLQEMLGNYIRSLTHYAELLQEQRPHEAGQKMLDALALMKEDLREWKKAIQ